MNNNLNLSAGPPAVSIPLQPSADLPPAPTLQAARIAACGAGVQFAVRVSRLAHWKQALILSAPAELRLCFLNRLERHP